MIRPQNFAILHRFVPPFLWRAKLYASATTAHPFPAAAEDGFPKGYVPLALPRVGTARRAGGTERQISAFTIISYAPPCVKSAVTVAGKMMVSFAITPGKVLEEKLFSANFKKMMKKA